jgi:hypothetical protein
VTSVTRRTSTVARRQLAALSFGGVLLSHALAYALTVRDPHERLQLLHATGHDYWSYFLIVAVVASAWGLCSFALGLTREREGWSSLGFFRHAATRLTLLQEGIFLCLEASERAVASGSVTALLSEPALPAGLLIQVLVAVLGAALLLGLVGAVRRVLRDRDGEPTPAALPSLRATSVAVRARPPLVGGPGLRAPPSPSVMHASA